VTRNEQYADRKRRGVCVNCESGLDGDPRVCCVECRDSRARSDAKRARAGKRKRGRSPRALLAHHARLRAQRDEAKQAGRCVHNGCRSEALDDNSYCADHRELHNAANRRYGARQRSARVEAQA
jgi:hypothetical protein